MECNPSGQFNTFALGKTQPFFKNDYLLFSRIKAIQDENRDGKNVWTQDISFKVELINQCATPNYVIKR